MTKTFASAAATLLAAATIVSANEPLKPSRPEPAIIESAPTEAAKETASKLKRQSASAPVKLTWRRNGTLQSASGFASRSYGGNKLEAATEFLAEHQPLVGGLPIQNLRPLQSRQLGSRTYVRLEQQLDGIPVRDAQVVLQVNAANAVERLSASVEPNILRKGAWRIEETAAIEHAVSAHGSKPSEVPRAERLYVLRDRFADPVWRVLFRSADPPGDWEYLISAESGRVMEKQNLRLGNRALGYAYPRNPIKSAREQVTLENLVSDQYLTSNQSIVFNYFPALKRQVAPGTVIQGAARENGHFLYQADDARASEVQLYYGMESASARFRALGFQGFREPLPGVVFFQDWDEQAQRFVGADNAFFSPVAFGDSKGGMFFYLTSRQGDTALDTDVIYHEYTHAVINELVGPRQSAAFKALNEGTADYFANSFLDDPVMAEYAAKLFNLRTPYLRRSDNEHAWPYFTVGESHADGNIWSGALWDVRQALGPQITDEIALNAIAMLSPNSEFFEAASAAIAAADELYGAGAAETVAGIMDERGIFTRAAKIASEAKWLSSGTSAESTIPDARAGFLLVGEQQYRIEVPHRATKLTVRLQANSDVRFYLRYRVPITVENGRIQAEQMSSTGTEMTAFLSLDNTPELQAGVYYIAVVNTATAPVKYLLQTAIENGDAAASPAVTFLESGASASGSAPSGPFLASRQFAIRVPEGASALSITLEGDEDVDLYVRFGGLVYITGTGYPQADLVSNSASSREDLRITGSNGGPLPAGMYVIGVYNYSSETTSFKIRAHVESGS